MRKVKCSDCDYGKINSQDIRDNEYKTECLICSNIIIERCSDCKFFNNDISEYFCFYHEKKAMWVKDCKAKKLKEEKLTITSISLGYGFSITFEEKKIYFKKNEKKFFINKDVLDSILYSNLEDDFIQHSSQLREEKYCNKCKNIRNEKTKIDGDENLLEFEFCSVFNTFVHKSERCYSVFRRVENNELFSIGEIKRNKDKILKLTIKHK